MNCKNCGKPNACVHLTDIIDGEKRTRVLCEKCAAEMGFVIDPKLIQAATSQLQKLIAPLLVTSPSPEPKEAAPIPSGACPNCGMTWAEFRKTNRFGCPEDYELFSGFLDEILVEIHGHTRHKGPVPERYKNRFSINERARNLRAEMEEAVKREEFERAAGLRDQITALESEKEGDAPTS